MVAPRGGITSSIWLLGFVAARMRGLGAAIGLCSLGDDDGARKKAPSFLAGLCGGGGCGDSASGGELGDGVMAVSFFRRLKPRGIST